MIALREGLIRHVSGWTGVGGGFFAWWWHALATWLPRSWRQVLGIERGRLLLHAEGDAVQLQLHDGEGLRDVARVPGLAEASEDVADPLAALLAPSLADLPRWLLLPATVGLRRRLALPAAAADRLRDVVGFEIDRQTPFAADAVVFDARLLGRRESDGQLAVELVVVPRGALDAQLAALGPLATKLAGIDISGDDGLPLGVNLLPPTQRRRQQDPWRIWNWLLAAVAVLALVLALWQVLVNRRAAADALQQTTEQRAGAARRVATQRAQLEAMVQGRAFLVQTRKARPTAVEILDALSRRLPDGTYLEKLSIEDDQLVLIGLSDQASALVGKLEGAKEWRSPALTGALQPDPRSHKDRFTLTAALSDSAIVKPVAQQQEEATDASTP